MALTVLLADVQAASGDWAVLGACLTLCVGVALFIFYQTNAVTSNMTSLDAAMSPERTRFTFS